MQLLNDFREWLTVKNKPAAARIYYFSIRKLLDKVPVDSLSVEAIQSFLDSIDNPYTRNVTHAATKMFIQFLQTRAESDEELFRLNKLLTELNSLKYASTKKTVAVTTGSGKLKLRKEALSEEGVIKLLKKLADRVIKNSDSPYIETYLAVFTGMVLTLYFGWRPVEATESFMRSLEDGKIDLKNRIMVIQGAKTRAERLLVWHESLDEFVRWWVYFARRKRSNGKPFLYDRILTRNLGFVIDDVKVTAKTGRKTVITLLRKRFMKEVGLDERYIPADIRQKLVEWWVGHTTTPVQDIYTDETEFIADLRVLACKTHFLPEIIEKTGICKVYDEILT